MAARPRNQTSAKRASVDWRVLPFSDLSQPIATTSVNTAERSSSPLSKLEYRSIGLGRPSLLGGLLLSERIADAPP